MRLPPTFVLSAFALITNPVCAKENVAPAMTPLASEWLSNPLEVQFTIKSRAQYVIYMNFHITEPSRISHLLDKESPEEARRLSQVLGWEVIDGRSYDKGFPGDILVQVQNTSGEVIQEQRVTRPKTSACYMGRYTNLTFLNNLAPNAYTVRFTCLDCSASLSILKFHVGIGAPHHGK